jgi:hypothetical protein
VIAPAASADDYCVQLADICDPGNEHMSLQDALDAAGATAVDDTIHIGPVTISEGSGGFDYLDYNDNDIAGNDVTLIGQGAAETTIQRADSMEVTTFETGVTDPGPDAHVTLQDLGFFIVGNGVDDFGFNGVRVREGGATLTRVEVTAQDSVFDHDFNSGARLVFASGPLTMTDSTIDGADNQNAECLTSSAANTPVVTGTVFMDCAFGVRATASSNPSIDRSTFTGGKTGAQIEDGASISINRSRFTGGTYGFYALNFLADGQFRIDNSLIARGPDAGGIRVAPGPGSESDGTVNQSTMAGTDLVPEDSSAGIAVVPEAGGDADVRIYDSIVTGFDSAILSNPGGLATSEYSFYDFDLSGGHSPGASDVDSDGGAVDPGFVDPPNDYSLASDSILRDQDPLTTPRPGFGPVPAEVITTDLALNLRIDNGARDIGAFEFPFVPEPTLTATSPASPANDNTPRIAGTAEAGSTVQLYTNAACTTPAGAPAGAADFIAPGIEVTVADNSTTTFYAKATDAGSFVSECSADSITYVEDSTPPPTGTPPAPATTGRRAAALKKCKKVKKKKARASCRKKANKLPR